MSVLDSRVTPEGYRGVSTVEYLQHIKNKLLEIESEMDLSAHTMDGMTIAIYSEILGILDEGLEAAYNSKNVNLAKGYELDVLSLLTGKKRRSATASRVELKFSGSPNLVISNSYEFTDVNNNHKWILEDVVTLDGNGDGTGNATCSTLGLINVDPDTITVSSKSISGLDSVTNPTIPFELGSNEQNDESLRRERNKTVSIGGTSQLDAMYSHLHNITGVTDVMILENKTGSTDSNGLPAHSVAVLVDGGSDEEIALAIFRSKTIGCNLFAITDTDPNTPDNTVVITDVYDKYENNKLTITFSRPIMVDISITVYVKSDGSLPEDAETQIKNKIMEYVIGDLELTGFNTTGYQVGEDVGVSQIATPVNFYIGALGNSYIEFIQINDKTYGQKVDIAKYEKASFSFDRITVNIS